MEKKEAMEILKDFHDKSALFSVRTALDTIFPELKESEDERIREKVITTIHLYYGEPLEDEAKEMIAWLEKQGEKGTNGNEREIPNSEQKPTKWSEEDEYLLGKTIQCLEEFIRIAKYCGIDVQSYQRDIDWVKSLKDRVGCEVNCTTTKECSEDDEQYLLVCKNALAKYQTTDKWDASIISHWLENKLKSVNPQNTWKPSEGQIKALEDSIEFLGCTKKVREDLKSLYEQLKKLREK